MIDYATFVCYHLADKLAGGGHERQMFSSPSEQQYYHLVWADDDYHSALDHNANEREGTVCVLRQINFQHPTIAHFQFVHIENSCSVCCHDHQLLIEN